MSTTHEDVTNVSDKVMTNLDADNFGNISNPLSQQMSPPPEPKSKASIDPEPVSTTELPEELVTQAKSYGFSDEDLKEMSPTALRRSLSAIDRRAMEVIERQVTQYTQSPGSPAPRTPANPWAGAGVMPAFSPPLAAPPAPSLGETMQVQPFEVKLSTDEYDDKVVETLKGMSEHYAKQLAQLQQQTTQFAAQQQALQQQQQQDQLAAWFDAKVAELGDDYESVLGAGTIDRLGPMSGAVNARLSAFETFARYLQYMPVTGLDDAFSRTIRDHFPAIESGRAAKSVSEQLRKRSSQTIGRPTTRRGNQADAEVDPVLGVSRSTVDRVQNMIDSLRQS